MPLNPLRNMPSVNELLDSAPLRKLVERISWASVIFMVRTVLDEVRIEVQTAAAEMTLPSVTELADRIARRILETVSSSLRPVINATGVLLPAELGRAPLADEAVSQLEAVARDYASVGIDLTTGRPCRPTAAVEGLLKELTGAEAALVVNNNTASLMLSLSALAAGREVLIARAHLIQTDDGQRLYDLMTAAGVTPREVGAINSVRPGDYAAALGPATAAILTVHPSGFAVAGAVESTRIEDLAALGRTHQVPVLYNLGAGTLTGIQDLGGTVEPAAGSSLRAGADVVMLSGDKLMGGPQSGLLVGRRALVDRIAAHPLARAVRIGKLPLAALEATLRLYHDPEKVRRAIPLLHLLSTSVDNLRNRAERLAPQLASQGVVAKATPQSTMSSIWGNQLPGKNLPSWCIVLEPKGLSGERLAAILRAGTPAVLCRLEQDRVVLDLRSVPPRQDQYLVNALAIAGNGGVGV